MGIGVKGTKYDLFVKHVCFLLHLTPYAGRAKESEVIQRNATYVTNLAQHQNFSESLNCGIEYSKKV